MRSHEAKICLTTREQISIQLKNMDPFRLHREAT
jgi:hypothetical protein